MKIILINQQFSKGIKVIIGLEKMTGFWVEYGNLTRKKKIRWTKEKLSEFKQPVTNFYDRISGHGNNHVLTNLFWTQRAGFSFLIATASAMHSWRSLIDCGRLAGIL